MSYVCGLALACWTSIQAAWEIDSLRPRPGRDGICVGQIIKRRGFLWGGGILPFSSSIPPTHSTSPSFYLSSAIVKHRLGRSLGAPGLWGRRSCLGMGPCPACLRQDDLPVSIRITNAAHRIWKIIAYKVHIGTI